MNFINILNQFRTLLTEAGAMSTIDHRNTRHNKHNVSISYKGGSDVFWFKEDYTPNQFPEPIKGGEFVINKLEEKLNLVYDKDFYTEYSARRD